MTMAENIEPSTVRNLEECLDIVKFLVVSGEVKPTAEHFNIAIQKGCLDIVKCLVVDGQCMATTEHLDTAIRRGYPDIVMFLVIDGGCKTTAEGLDTAIQKGHFNIGEYLFIDCGCKPKSAYFNAAIKTGYCYFEIVKYLVTEGGCNPTAEHLSIAIQEECLDIVKFLVISGEVKPTAEHLNIAIFKKYCDILKWLVVNGGCKPTTEHLDAAIQTSLCLKELTTEQLEKHLHIMKYLVVDGECKPTIKQLNTVIHMRYTDFVKCLVIDGGCKPSSEQLDIALKMRHSEIVKCLVTDGSCKPTIKQLDVAIKMRHSEIVKYLVVNGGCKPTTEQLDSAINEYSDIVMKNLVVEPTTEQHNTMLQIRCSDIMKCLVVNGGCKPTIEQIHTAITKGVFDIVKCLVVDCGCKLTIEHLQTAIQKRYFDIVKCLIVKGGCKPTAEHLDTAIQMRYSDIVKCLVVRGGCKPTAEHLGNAIQKGYSDIIECLIVDGGFKPTTEHLNTAIQVKHPVIVKYLVIDGGCKPTNDNLNIAIKMGYIDTVRCLVIDGGCKPTAAQLHTAIHYNAIEIAHFLIDNKIIDLNSRVGPNQRNVLHVACAIGQLEVVEHLIKDGRCNIREKDTEGNTALHLSCYYNKYDIVKALLDTGKYDVTKRNRENSAALDLSNSPEIIRELIKYGATPTNVYKRFGSVLGNSPRQPIEAPVKVFVTGDPSGGKSTLTKSLQREVSTLARVFSRVKKVSNVDEKTAGIIPYQFESKQFGSVIFYDLAGQREFYGSHAAVLNNTICASPPIFLLVIDLQRSEEELKQSILYWLSFLENQCSSVTDKPHVIIIGSHADTLKSRGEDPRQKDSIVRDALSNLCPTWCEFAGFIPMDCQYPRSSEIDKLRHQLGVSCKALRVTSTIQFNCHCLLVYLIDTYFYCPAVTLRQVKEEMLRVSDKISLCTFVPLDIEVMCNMCEQLNDRGHILFLKNPTKVEDSWIIIDKAALLSEVTGTVFAPEGFKQHCKLASSTGVVPLSEIVNHFPKHNSDMLISFFTHLEFCSEISDEETLELIEAHQSLSKSNSGVSANAQRVEDAHSNGMQSAILSMDQYFLFPGLITIDRPDRVWETSSQLSFHCGWMLQCSQPTQFFSSRFLQVLLLRIIFAFALPPHREELDPSVPALQRKCSIWRNGIFWGDRNGVQVLVEVVKHKTVIVLMRSQHLTGECLQLRSSIISNVLKTVTDLCPKVSTTESFINPSEILQYPIDSVSELTCFSISEVAASVSSAKTAVVTSTGKSLPLQSLLTFEPFAKLGPLILHRLFDETREDDDTTDEFLMDFARVCCSKDSREDSHHRLTILQQCLSVDQEPREYQENPVHRCFLLLQTWKDQTAHPTLQALRRVLDQHSVFGGRNPMELGGVGFSPSLHLDTSCESGSGEQETEEGEIESKVNNYKEEKLKRKEEAEEEAKKKYREMVHYKVLTKNTDSNATSEIETAIEVNSKEKKQRRIERRKEQATVTARKLSSSNDDHISMEVGTFSQFFVLDDLGFLMESLCQAAPQWYYIGLQLGVHPTDLDNIRHNISLLPDSPKSYLREMLKTWLCLASPQAGSLPALLSALQSETVRENRLAKSVERKSMEYLERRFTRIGKYHHRQILDSVTSERSNSSDQSSHINEEDHGREEIGEGIGEGGIKRREEQRDFGAGNSIVYQDSGLSGQVEESQESYYNNVSVAPSHTQAKSLCARVLYDFQAVSDDEISFDVDDVIENIEQVFEEWWMGEVNGERGLFPANHVELI